jgi:hypothetical protein
MGKAEKPKNRPQMTDKAQSERFRQTAQELECNENEEAFEQVFEKVIPPKRIKSSQQDKP